MVCPFEETDIAPFLVLARREGWICESWELSFLLRVFPRGCFVWRDLGGSRGYITSIRYGKSGWIGNLLVQENARRRGIGRQLMEAAIASLLRNGVETVWLTASEEGAGLYRKLGFFPSDTVCRWTGKGTRRHRMQQNSLDMELVSAVDRAGWGDRRDALLGATLGRSRFYSSSGGFVCCQQWDDGVQIGPWGCLIPNQAAQLLDGALAGAGRQVFLDVPMGNHLATALLKERGFMVKGSNLLMYLGAEPMYRPHNVFALASMGSMG